MNTELAQKVEKRDERNDINKYREMKKRKKAKIRGLVFLFTVIVIVLVAVNWKAIIAPFNGAGLDIGEGGFPVNLPGSTRYVLGEMGENFYLLTDTYLYTYNGDGAQIAEIQHGFQKPASSSGSKRTLVYDKNGTVFKTFSRSQEIYSGSVDDSIVFGEMGSDERCAVVTTSTRYSNYLYVFNGSGTRIFRWASPEDKIMRVCFGAGDKSIYASVIGEHGGELSCSIVRFDIDNSESEVWRTAIGNSITYSLEYCGDGIYAVTAGGAFLLDEKNGEIKAKTTFAREITGIPETDGMRALIFRDSASNGETASVYNNKLEATSAVSISDVTAFDVSGGKLYVLNGSRLQVYNSALEGIRSYELDNEYSDVKIIGKYAYLLGYNTVWRVELD